MPEYTPDEAVAQTEKKIKAFEWQMQVLIVQANEILTMLVLNPGIYLTLERKLKVLNDEIWEIQMQIMHCDQPLMHTRSIGDCFNTHPK